MTKLKIVIFIEYILSLEIFFAPVMIAFFLHYSKLSFYQMSVYFSVLMISSWIFEVPSGVLSDSIGRKKALLIGKIIYLLGLIGLLYFKSFYELLILAIILSLGSSISSGNLSAICFQNLECLGIDKKEYFRITSKASSLGFLSSGIAAILGGYLGSINLSIPLIIDCTCIIITIITSGLFLVDKQIVDLKSHNRRIIFKEYKDISKRLKKITKDGFDIFKNSRTILLLVSFSACCFGVLRSGFNFYQPILNELSFDLVNFGFLLAGFNIIGSIISLILSKISKKDLNYSAFFYITIAILLSSAFFIIIGGKYLILVIISFVLHQIIRGYADTFVDYYINVEIPSESESRTTILSISYFIKSMIGAFVMWGSGLLTEYTTLTKSFGFTSVLGAISIFLLFIFNKNYSGVLINQK